jgi:hypothetical protein
MSAAGVDNRVAIAAATLGIWYVLVDKFPALIVHILNSKVSAFFLSFFLPSFVFPPPHLPSSSFSVLIFLPHLLFSSSFPIVLPHLPSPFSLPIFLPRFSSPSS